MPYKDKDRQRQFDRKWKRKRVEQLQTLKDKPCADCGNKYHPAAMQWDHIKGTKFKSLSKMPQYSVARQLKEIEKCELVCANCHAIRTYNRSMALLQD